MQSSLIDKAPPPQYSRWAYKLRYLPKDVRLYAALGSLVLSAWCLFLDNVINNDAVLYLRAAELLANGAWQAAITLYKWPLYSLLIAAVHIITGLSFDHAAYVLNAALTALTVVVFVSLVGEVGGNRRVVIASIFVVLFYAGLNKYRPMVIRDHGYLAFYLWSLFLYVKNMKNPKLATTLGWVATMTIAALFRLEAFVLLAALVLFHSWRRVTSLSRKLALIVISAIGAFLLLSALAWWLFGGVELSGTNGFLGAWRSLLHTFSQATTETLSAKVEVIAGLDPDKYSRYFAYAVLLAALVILLVWNVMSTLTPLYTALTGHALYRRLLFPEPGAKAVWLWMIAVNLGVLMAILLVRLFLTGRFPLAVSLTLMLAVPFSLAALYDHWQSSRTKAGRRPWLFAVVCVLFLLTAAQQLSRPTHKNHLKQAGLWLRAHAPAQATLFSNDAVLWYYSQRRIGERYQGIDWDQTLGLVKSKARLQYDYLALRLRERHSIDEALLIQTIGSEPIVRFANRYNDQVLVFRLH
jgi:hypothetical protein